LGYFVTRRLLEGVYVDNGMIAAGVVGVEQIDSDCARAFKVLLNILVPKDAAYA